MLENLNYKIGCFFMVKNRDNKIIKKNSITEVCLINSFLISLLMYSNNMTKHPR